MLCNPCFFLDLTFLVCYYIVPTTKTALKAEEKSNRNVIIISYTVAVFFQPY